MDVIAGKMTVWLWSQFYGNCEPALHGEIFQKNFAHAKQHTTVLIIGLQKVCGRIFFELRGEIDTEWVFTDGSYVRAHQHVSGARCGEEREIGKSRGGPTTKIHIVADAHGNPIDFEITGGEVHDSKVAGHIIKKVGTGGYFIADKGYDPEEIHSLSRKANMIPVIPRKSNNTKPNSEFDAHLYAAPSGRKSLRQTETL